jgi:putative chitinase
LDNAQYLAGLLHNPSVGNTNGSRENSSGANQQDQALLDFLAVYAATQKGENGGGWNNINVVNSDADTIRTALFGDGTQTNGLIDENQILIGGAAKTLGEAMTAESLATFMGKTAAVTESWVEPLKQAMKEFGIITPQRIVPFLAQVKAEGNLQGKPESLKYITNTAQTLANTFKSAFSYNFNYNSHTSALYRAGLKKDQYNDDSRTKEQNAQLFYDEVIRPVLNANGNRWTDNVQMLIANRVYSSDYGTGYERGNGDQASGDGWKYRGHGQLQLTGKGIIVGKSLSGANYSGDGFADYLLTHYQNVGLTAAEAQQLYQNIVDDPTVLDIDPTLSARAAAWYWATHGKNAKADLLDEDNRTSPNVSNNIYLGGNQFTDLITKGIATYAGSFEERWRNWRNNITESRTASNPYENLQSALKNIGFNTESGQTYQQQFGIALENRTPLSIAVSHKLMAASLAPSIGSTSELRNTTADNNHLQNLINQAKTDLGFTQEDHIMLIADLLTDAPSATSPIVLVVKAATETTKPRQRVAAVCMDVAGGERDVHPEIDAESYHANFEGRTHVETIDSGTVKVQILQESLLVGSGKLIDLI